MEKIIKFISTESRPFLQCCCVQSSIFWLVCFTFLADCHCYQAFHFPAHPLSLSLLFFDRVSDENHDVNGAVVGHRSDWRHFGFFLDLTVFIRDDSWGVQLLLFVPKRFLTPSSFGYSFFTLTRLVWWQLMSLNFADPFDETIIGPFFKLVQKIWNFI